MEKLGIIPSYNDNEFYLNEDAAEIEYGND